MAIVKNSNDNTSASLKLPHPEIGASENQNSEIVVLFGNSSTLERQPLICCMMLHVHTNPQISQTRLFIHAP